MNKKMLLKRTQGKIKRKKKIDIFFSLLKIFSTIFLWRNQIRNLQWKHHMSIKSSRNSRYGNLYWHFNYLMKDDDLKNVEVDCNSLFIFPPRHISFIDDMSFNLAMLLSLQPEIMHSSFKNQIQKGSYFLQSINVHH